MWRGIPLVQAYQIFAAPPLPVPCTNGDLHRHLATISCSPIPGAVASSPGAEIHGS